MQMNVSMKHWWIEADRQKPKYLEESLSRRHLVHRNDTRTDLKLNPRLRDKMSGNK